MSCRAERAVSDVVAVERIAPGMVRVCTWGGAYTVDARDAGCYCPDKKHNKPTRCKHEQAAILAASGHPTPFVVTESLDRRVATDGGRPERPADCNCAESNVGIACWPCYEAGFDFEDGASNE